MLSARKTAQRLNCAQDYVGRLCREEKLTGLQVRGMWFVSEESIGLFEQMRQVSKAIRAQVLADKRRSENREFKKQNGSFFEKTFSSFKPRNVGIVAGLGVGAALLFGALVFASVAHTQGSRQFSYPDSPTQSAALAQTESPFFGTPPPAISLGGLPQGIVSSVSNFFSNTFAALFGSKQSTSAVATAPVQTPLVVSHTNTEQPAQTSLSASAPIIQNNTYPVVEHTVEQTVVQGGVTQAQVDQKLQELANALQSQISFLANPGNSSPLQNFNLPSVINNLSNITVNGVKGLTAADIPQDIVAANYLALSGGVVTGSTTVSSLTADTLSAGTFQTSGNLSSGTSTLANLTVTNISTSTFAGDVVAQDIATPGTLNVGQLSTLSGGFLSLASSTINNAFAVTGTTTLSALQESGLAAFNSGFTAAASSTVGNGTPTGGLTISGGATTTGNAYFASTLGIGTTTPTSAFAVQGNGYFTGGLGVGIATTAPGVLQTTGNVFVGGNLLVTGNSTTLGSNTSNTLTINSSIISSIVPNQNITYDLGSPSFYWRNVYVGNIVANNISAASTTIAGTASQTFTVNSANTTSDAQDSSLIFFRGNVVPNALLNWDSTNKRFAFNQPVFIQNASSNGGGVVSLNVEALAGQTASLFQVASSTGTNFLDITANGNVGIGTTSPFALFSVAGNGFFNGTLTASNITATGTLAVTGLSTLTGGLLALASSTVGAGGQATGLTISGGATTTGFLTVQGNATSTFAAGLQATTLNLTSSAASSTASNGLNLTGGCFAVQGLCLGGLTGTQGQVTFFNGTNTAVGTSTLFINTTGFVGVGTTTPSQLFAVQGSGLFSGNLSIAGLIATGTAAIAGAATLSNTLGVTGLSTLTGGFLSAASSTVNGILAVVGAGTFNSTLGVNGAATLNSTLTANGLALFDANASTTELSATQAFFGGLATSTFTQAGFLGVGTTSPAFTFSVQGNSYQSGTAFFGGAITATSTLTVSGVTTLGFASTTQISSTGAAYFATTGGNVGIGTTSPFALFSVAGNGFFNGNLTASNITATGTLAVSGAATLSNTLNVSGLALFNANASTTQLSATVGYFGGTATSTFTSAGFLGVGTTSPTALFSVQGNSYHSGTAFFGGAITATSTFAVTGLSTLTGGLLALASSTVGAGGQATGLTISGGATTTGFLTVQGNATSTFAAGLQATTLNLTSSAASSTASNGLNLTGGCFAVNGICLSGPTGTQGQITYFNGTNTAVGTSSLFISSAGNVGVGTTSPLATLSIQASVNTVPFSVASSTGATLLSVNADGSLSAKLKQLTADYTVDSGSAQINVGDVVAYINGNAQKAHPTIYPSTPVAANSVSSTVFESAATLSSTSFVLVYRNGNTNSPNAVVGTVSGTTITYGTPVALTADNGTSETVAALSSTSFVAGYVNQTHGGEPYAVVSTVSGTTITPGTPAVVDSTAIADWLSISALSSTSFVMAYRNDNTNLFPYAVVSTVSGTTITHGTPVALAAFSGYPGSVAALSSSSFVVGYTQQNTTSDYAVASTVSGTTITEGTPVTFTGGAVASVAALSSTSFVVGYLDGSSFAHAVAGSVSGTTVTLGTTVAITAVGVSYLSAAALDSTHFVAAYSGSVNIAVVSSVSGTTITLGTPVGITTANGSYDSVAALNSTNFVVGYEDTSTGFANTVVSSAVAPNLNSTNILGVATNATSTTNNTVTVASSGIVTGFSGLTAGSTYYYSLATGATTTIESYKMGLALTSTSMLLDSGSGAGSDQFFGDAVFANNFRITEDAGSPQGLIFENQLGRNIATLDEDGNLNLAGQISATNINPNMFSLLGTTSVSELITATSTTASTTPPEWAGVFANAGDLLTTTLQSFSGSVIQVLGKVVYATVGVFDQVIAKVVTAQQINTEQLCVSDNTGKVCVTKSQLSALLSGVAASGGNSSSNAATSTPPTATSTPPVITLIGADPAQLNVGDAYIDPGVTVTSSLNPNLGYSVAVDGSTTTTPDQLHIDTSIPGTHIILFSATDQDGNIGSATRTVIVSAVSTSTASSTQ